MYIGTKDHVVGWKKGRNEVLQGQKPVEVVLICGVSSTDLHLGLQRGRTCRRPSLRVRRSSELTTNLMSVAKNTR